MKNSILMGALVLAMALLPSFASAGSASYNAPFPGLPDHFDITGTLLSVPMLSQSTGTAVIVDAVFNPLTGRWTGDILCVIPDANNRCTGTVSS